jgi:formylglycine-generating enzyme required for sulfatase activity
MRNLFALIIASIVLLSFTRASAQTPTPSADLNRDGIVDDGDLLLLLGQWHVGERYTPTPTATPGTPDDEITINLPNLPVGAKPLLLVRITAGSLQMGANDPGWSFPEELPEHGVNIANDFYIGKYEVTQAQWTAVMGSSPAAGYGVGNDYPVYNVSWNDCKTFTDTLNTHITATGQGPATMRLPSEAEWEYACRAGTTTRFFFGDSNCSSLPYDCTSCNLDSYAWWCGNSGSTTHEVGGKISNAWGLCDMSGNVFEWVEDCWHDNYTDAPANGSAWLSPTSDYRVFRGGAWDTEPAFCRSSFRGANTVNDLGFRIARTP